MNVIVGGKQEDQEPQITKQQAQALVPRIQLARQLPSPEAGYNLYSALADKRENEIKGLMRHLEVLKGGTTYSQPQPTGRALLDSLNAVGDDQNALSAFMTPSQKPVPESPIFNSPDSSPACSGGGRNILSPRTDVLAGVQRMKTYLLLNAQHLQTTARNPTVDKWKETIIGYQPSSIGRMWELYDQIERTTRRKGVAPTTPNSEAVDQFKNYMDDLRKELGQVK